MGVLRKIGRGHVKMLVVNEIVFKLPVWTMHWVWLVSAIQCLLPLVQDLWVLSCNVAYSNTIIPLSCNLVAVQKKLKLETSICNFTLDFSTKN